MNHRLAHQIVGVRRVLTELERRHVSVFRVELDANSPRPIVRTGPGPFAWTCSGFGHDPRGQYVDYVAHLRGVELHHRQRTKSGRDHG